jgi:hypothetical protein
MSQLTPLNYLDRLRGRPRIGVKTHQKEILVIGFYTYPGPTSSYDEEEKISLVRRHR